MKFDLQDAILLITSTDHGNDRFGTGFIIHKDENGTYILTCAHVVDDVGGSAKDKHPVLAGGYIARVIALDDDRFPDLAVLRINEVLNTRALSLRIAGHTGTAFKTAGWYKASGRQRVIKTLHGELGKRIALSLGGKPGRFSAWDINIIDEDDLERGYSGSPVFEETAGSVLGVISDRKRAVKRGQAISIEALETIWPEMPPGLIKRESAANRSVLSLIPGGGGREVRTLNELKKKIRGKENRLQILKKHLAAPDFKTAAHVVLKMEELEDELENLQTQLAALQTDELHEGLIGDGIQTDWGEAPEVSGFVGRAAELSKLRYWMMEKHSRVVIVTGFGGIGKTSLTVTLVDQIKKHFHYLFWRTLQNAPPVEEILKGCIQFLSDRQKVDLPDSIDAQISTLMEFLRAKRCLLVLDNLETVLRQGESADLYKEGYEGYERLIERVAQTSHQSCLLLTSRERPKSFKQLEGKHSPVKSLQVEGIAPRDGRALLRYYEISADEREAAELIGRAGGNPMALKLASTTIDEWHAGDVTAFLEESGPVLDDIRPLLEQHLARLSELGLVTIYWIAIERDMISTADLARDILFWRVVKSAGTAADDLRSNVVTEVSVHDLKDSLETLYRHSLIEKRGVYFTLQPVAMDYLTEKIVEQVIEEILSGQVKFLQSHALMKAQAKEYIRQSQARLLLGPIIDRLLAKPGVTKSLIEARLAEILSAVRVKVASAEADKGQVQIVPGYIGGNALNLLLQMESDVQGSNFSGLAVWQSYLKGVRLPDVNFAGADLSRSVFTETFGRVFSLEFSPDGELLAIGTENGEIRVWQTVDGQPLHILKGHKTRVRSLAFSPDGQKLATGSFDQTVRLWDLTSGKCLQLFENESHLVRSVAFSPNGTQLASGHQDKVIRIWDVEKGTLLKSLHGHDREVRVVVFGSDDQTVISGSSDKTIRVWDLSTGTCVKILEGHADEIWSVACHEGNIISGGSGNERSLILWDLRSGKSTYILQGHEGWVLAVAVSPDGQTIASGSSDCTVRLWETETGRCRQTLLGHTAPIWSLAFSPDGETLSSGSEDQSVRVWHIDTGHCLRIMEGYSNLAWSVAFSPDGRRLVGGYNDGVLRVWDVVSGQSCCTFYGHKKGVRSVAVSADGRTLASGSEDRTVRLWDMETMQRILTLKGHTDWVMAVAFSPAGDILVSGSSDQTVRIWRIDETPQEQSEAKKILLDTILVRSIAFDAKGDQLAVGSGDGTVQLRQISSGRSDTLSDHGGWVMSVAYSADGRKMASGSNDGTVGLYDFETRNKTALPHSSPVLAVALSPDGAILASGSVDHSIQLWDVNASLTGPPLPLTVLTGHEGAIRSLAFSSDGKNLASSGDDGTIRLWRVQTGLCLKTLQSERPYERMNIARVTGITESQKLALKDLGAVEIGD